ncbi:MAG TPA: hypothetical protein VF100_12895 [Thermoanaerobaculia bacterium]
MTRRLTPFLFAALVAVALVAAAPLSAQTPEPAEPMPEETPSPAVGERVERAEEGTISGRIVLLDADNLIIETAEGDRAFSIREESTLPDELRRSEDWASFRGTPVRITFTPGDEGELRVVRTVTLTDAGATTATTAAEETAERPLAARTDLGDESDTMEPTDIEEPATTSTVERTALTTTTTTGRQIAAANPDEDDDLAATGLADDDDLPPGGDTMAGLPATASPLPWLALIGTLALAGALGLGHLQRRRQRVPATRGR